MNIAILLLVKRSIISMYTCVTCTCYIFTYAHEKTPEFDQAHQSPRYPTWAPTIVGIDVQIGSLVTFTLFRIAAPLACFSLFFFLFLYPTQISVVINSPSGSVRALLTDRLANYDLLGQTDRPS